MHRKPEHKQYINN